MLTESVILALMVVVMWYFTLRSGRATRGNPQKNTLYLKTGEDIHQDEEGEKQAETAAYKKIRPAGTLAANVPGNLSTFLEVVLRFHIV